MTDNFFEQLDKIFISDEVVRRVKKNLPHLTDLIDDISKWLMDAISDPESLTRLATTWNVRGDGFLIIIDAATLEVVTARKEKSKKGSNLEDVGIIKKLDDALELKQKLIEIFDSKTHRRISKYSLLLAEHIIELADLTATASEETKRAIEFCFEINKKWQEGRVHFQEARDVAFMFHELARAEKDPIKEKALRALGQAAATPHVKRHALIASDYAVKLINLMYPNDLKEATKERELQIEMMQSV